MSVIDCFEIEVPAADHTPLESAHGAFISLLDGLLTQAEADEADLSYHTECRSEAARRQSGSYYTPIDVADFFWAQFFYAQNIATPEQAETLVREHTFVEPSAGSGVLILALIKKLMSFGLDLRVLKAFDLHIVDINPSALSYIKRQFLTLNEQIGQQLLTPHFHQADFRDFETDNLLRRAVYFGNPPFVKNPRGSKWKNMYADFLAKCLDARGQCAGLHFIVPLSIAFSRDYALLRERLKNDEYTVLASHFDNIPDTLFKSGKPQSANSNKANSQRCTILSAISSGEHSIHSTGLQRWSVAQRANVLGSVPNYVDVSDYDLDNQFLRPKSQRIAQYLQANSFEYRLGDLSGGDERQKIHIASVARNFIPIRGQGGGSVNTFGFGTAEEFYRFLGIVASDAFFDYWISVGDGFHVTKSNIRSFPISKELNHAVTSALPKIKKVWKARELYKKSKLNSGTIVSSYDFSMALPSLIDVDHFDTTKHKKKSRRLV